MSIKEKLDLRFLLPVFTSTVGLFIFLTYKIIDLTTLEPTNDYLISLSICHYLSFICAFLVFIVLANQGMQHASIDKRFELLITKRADSAQKKLLLFWPFLLTYSVVSLVCESLFSSFDLEIRSAGSSILSIFLTIIIIKISLGITAKLLVNMFNSISIKQIVFFVIGYIVFVSIAVLSTSGVWFESDKKFYTQNETVRIMVKPKGYVFLPYIKKVDYALSIEPIATGSDHSYYFDLKDYGSNTTSLVEVIYETQIFEVEKVSYFDINVLPK